MNNISIDFNMLGFQPLKCRNLCVSLVQKNAVSFMQNFDFLCIFFCSAARGGGGGCERSTFSNLFLNLSKKGGECLINIQNKKLLSELHYSQ